MVTQKKEDIIEELFAKGILINEEALKNRMGASTSSEETIFSKLAVEEDLLVLNSDYLDVLTNQSSLVDWYELDRFRVDAEKERNEELYQNELQNIKKTKTILNLSSSEQEHEDSGLEISLDEEKKGVNFSREEKNENIIIPTPEELYFSEHNLSLGSVEITLSYENKPKKYTVNDFTNIFVSRYKYLEKILRNRQELQSTLSISRILSKREKEKVSIIGIIEDIGITKSGHIMLSVEDLTGKIKVLITQKNKEVFTLARELVPDEIVGITGMCGDKIIFADNIVWPEIPETNELKKAEKEEYAVFLSDIHVGSKLFLKEEFQKFLSWISGESGNEKQKEIAQKIKYVLIAGDLVDGVGVYPSQEDELEIKEITAQYEEFCRLIRKIPSDKQIVVCPGNHDLVHLAEPQPIFYKKYTPSLFQIPNLKLITNPGMVTIGKTENFSGFNVLLYHGYSFDYYVSNVETIRNGGGYNRADLIMKFLLRRRHLAPSFKSTPYYPGYEEDALLIKKIPDFFVTGHIHYSKVANYKGVTMICGSCWQAKTSFQEKMGHKPEPGRVPVVNLKTREVKIFKFFN